MSRIVIIGAGPAGLAAAIHAARAGAGVLVLERNAQTGAKLLATGGGRCNVTNNRPPGEWPALFGKNGRFIMPALEFLSRDRLAAWFEELGQPLASPDGFHLFPQSNSAKAVRDALLREALRLGARVEYGRRVRKFLVEGGALAGVEDDGGVRPCDRAILATGGGSWPATGSTGDGGELAARLGHKVIPAYPGLVGLRAANLDADLAGLVLPSAVVSFKEKVKCVREGAGELLLTHTGISGPAVLDMSGAVSEALAGGPEVQLRLRWCAVADRDEWLRRLVAWRTGSGGTPVVSLLRQYIPQRLARWLCGWAGLDAAVGAAALRADGRDRLVEALSGFPARVTASEGWDKAMITRGGVDVRGVDPKTLESRLVPGLRFAGEVLDIDGPCGGYNLHWAFASGALAGSKE